MENNLYKAYAEVDEILSFMEEKYVEKIPYKIIKLPLINIDKTNPAPVLLIILYNPIPIKEMCNPEIANICPIPAAENKSDTFTSRSSFFPSIIAS